MTAVCAEDLDMGLENEGSGPALHPAVDRGSADRAVVPGAVDPGAAYRAVDLVAAERAVADLLVALGHDPTTEGLAETPARVASAYAELLTPKPFRLTTFPNDEGYDELVLARDIPFQSVCQHHLLPFHGRAHVGYIPEQRIVGLSKLARVTDHFARGLQLQERLTQQIADCLQDRLSPKGVGVVVEAEHQCMTARGIRSQGSKAVTSAVRGRLREDPRTRQEFFSLTGLVR